MSKIPDLIQAELIGVPFYLKRVEIGEGLEVRKVCELEIGLLKAQITLRALQMIIADDKLTRWAKRIDFLLNNPGTTEKMSRRHEVLRREIEYGIELLESTVRSSLLKCLRDFLIASRDGRFDEYYIQFAKQEGEVTENGGGQTDALKKIREFWARIVNSGALTIWENAVYQQGRTFRGGVGSLCHGFSTGPVSFFQRTILGIKPLTPGFRKFDVTPVPLDLDYASGHIPTPAGPVAISWRRRSRKVEVVLQLPPGLMARTPIGNLASGTHKFEFETGTMAGK